MEIFNRNHLMQNPMRSKTDYLHNTLRLLLLCIIFILVSCEEKSPINESNGKDEDATEETIMPMKISKITATTAEFEGYLEISDEDTRFSQVTIYYSEKDNFSIFDAQHVSTASFDCDRKFALTIQNLEYNTTYYYCIVTQVKDERIYGNVDKFSTNDISVELVIKDSCIRADQPRAKFEGIVNGMSGEDLGSISIQVNYSKNINELLSNCCEYAIARSYGQCDESTLTFSAQSEVLDPDAKYYYCPHICQEGVSSIGEIKEFQTLHPYTTMFDLDVVSAVDLSSSSSANCYIVSAPGLYKFKTVKGNSSSSVGEVESCSIVWESFGTKEIPEYFELIKAVSYKEGYIIFQTAEVFKEGNAVIAAKDADNNILWSWHIWMTEMPQEQVYYNNAGIAMDRNLGATSAIPGDVRSLGLLYQWGRKDPFLGASSNEYDTTEEAASTITWPHAKGGDWFESDEGTYVGTVEYAIAHPTTFIMGIWHRYGWYYDNVGTSQKPVWTATKSIYDPCPPGWHITEEGEESIWAKAFDTIPDIRSITDDINLGVNFSGLLGEDSSIWYPYAGYRYFSGGELRGVGGYVNFWTAVNDNYKWYDGYSNQFSFNKYGDWGLSESDYRSRAVCIRCVKE